MLTIWLFITLVRSNAGSSAADDLSRSLPLPKCQEGINNCLDCPPYHVAYNGSICLPGSLLDFQCKMDDQCTIKVANSFCKNGTCDCTSSYTKYRRHSCLAGAAFNELCISDEHCTKYSEYSYCKFLVPNIYGKCRCSKGYAPVNGKCVPVLGSICKYDQQCRMWDENAYCRRESGTPSYCICKSPFVLSTNKLECLKQKTKTKKKNLSSKKLKIKSLGKACIRDSQCKAIDRHSSCIDWICQCQRSNTFCNSSNKGCYRDTFQCDDGRCISWYFVCDGRKQCKDGSDEDRCNKKRCPIEAFRCLDGECTSRGSICNGKTDCKDGSDEIFCNSTVSIGVKEEETRRMVQLNAFRCANGQYVAPYSFCNGIIDCGDKSDEDPISCSEGKMCGKGSFRCTNGGCRSTAILCSGSNGCGDNSDEIHCNVCSCPDENQWKKK